MGSPNSGAASKDTNNTERQEEAWEAGPLEGRESDDMSRVQVPKAL